MAMISTNWLARYVDEFTFRLNEGNVKEHTLARLDSFVGSCSWQTDHIQRTDGGGCMNFYSLRQGKVMKKVPEILDRITDAVLAYKPKPKTKAAKRRKRKRNRDAKKS